MASIGEKIKEKLHLGHDSGHGDASTAAHETAKTTTSAPTDTGTETSTMTGTATQTSYEGTAGQAYPRTPTTSPKGGTMSGPATTYPVGPGTDQTYPKTGSQERGTGMHAEGERRGAVCGTKTYTTVEDRPVEKEIIERVIEHHPVEKKFVVETRPAGEHELADQRRDESIGVREEIKRAAKTSPCEGAPELVLQK